MCRVATPFEQLPAYHVCFFAQLIVPYPDILIIIQRTRLFEVEKIFVMIYNSMWLTIVQNGIISKVPSLQKNRDNYERN